MKKLIVLFILFASPCYAQNTSTTQMQLVQSAQFLARVQYLLTQQAVVVKAEALATACHLVRSVFANQVINNPGGAASSSAVMLAGSTNLIGTVVGNANPNLVDSSATDAAILSQVATLWNALSKCDTGS